jgi:prepilin-type N-terminal cleavage/methylation domain-containing protein
MTQRVPAPTIDRRGLSLVEMLVAITIFGVAMAVIFSFVTGARRSYANMSDRVEYQQSVRAVLSLISRELRSAGCDPGGANFDAFAVADQTNLRFRMDLDGDGAIEVAEPAEDVVYQYDAAQEELTRDSGSGGQTVLRNVTALAFRYFDEAGAALNVLPLSAADRAAVRFVEVDITGVSERGEQLQYVTRVFVRNG